MLPHDLFFCTGSLATFFSTGSFSGNQDLCFPVIKRHAINGVQELLVRNPTVSLMNRLSSVANAPLSRTVFPEDLDRILQATLLVYKTLHFHVHVHQ